MVAQPHPLEPLPRRLRLLGRGRPMHDEGAPTVESRATCTFWRTVSEAKVAVIWNVRLTPRRHTPWGGSPVSREPSSLTSPASGRSCPESMLNSVVFPAPLGPMRAWISPRGSARSTPSTARTPPNALRSPRTSSTVSVTPVSQSSNCPRLPPRAGRQPVFPSSNCPATTPRGNITPASKVPIRPRGKAIAQDHAQHRGQ